RVSTWPLLPRRRDRPCDLPILWQLQETDRSSPAHIDTRSRCFVLLCNQPPAKPTESHQHGWTRSLDRRSKDSRYGKMSSAAAPRRKSQAPREERREQRRKFFYSLSLMPHSCVI